MTTKYIALIFCILLNHLTVNACNCRPLEDFSQLEFNELGVIFTGQVVDQYRDTVSHSAIIKFKVKKLFKGQADDGFVYAVNLTGCPIQVEKDEYLLLFLYGKVGRPHINYCSRRIRIANIENFSTPDWLNLYAQKPDGFHKSYHSNNTLASEGRWFNQKPEGYWKYYNRKGYLTLEGYYMNGRRDSIWTNYDSESKSRTVISYKNDQRHGKTVYYNDNGNIESENNFINGVEHGDSYGLYEDGTVSWEAHYKMGEKVESTHYYESGRKESYLNDTIQVRWYKNGNKEYERYFKYGKYGLQQSWWENGQIRERLTFDENGDEKIFYAANENGEVMVKNGTGYYEMWGIKGTLKDSLKTGIWREEYGDGLVKETSYKKGIKDGTFKRWNKDGNLIFDGAHKDGEPIGIWRFWYNNGQIRLERKWLDGENLMLNSWDPQGNQMVMNGNGTHIDYDDNGEKGIMSAIEYKNGR